jgi:4-amino-4-deoxy-L-arabinose transferase-like glycosyltransferase
MKTKVLQSLKNHEMTITMILIGLIACYAVYELHLATLYGPAFGSDSVTYMTSAKNLVAGRGFGLINPDGSFRFLPYAPPLYPLVLSLPALLGLDLVQAGFWVNAILFMATIILLGWGMWYLMRSPLAAVLLATLLAFSSVLIELHIWIMTDALCLTLGMGGMLLMLVYLKSRSKKAFFWSAALTGLAVLTRYAGVSYCITGALAVMLLGSQAGKKRVVAGVLYAFLSALPLLIWMLVEMSMAGAVGSRALQPMSDMTGGIMNVLRSLKESIYLWLPYFLPLSQKIGSTAFRLLYIGAALTIIGIVTFVILRLQRQQPQNWRQSSGVNTAVLFIIFCACYLVVIIFSYTCIYPRLSLVDRMFAPLNVSLMVLIGLVIALLYQEFHHWLPRLVTIALAVLLAVVFYGGARAEIALQTQYPMGYSSFNGSGIVEYLKQLPENTPIISDKTAIILHYTGRPAYAIQEFFSEEAQAEFLPYGSDMNDEAQRVFREDDGALVLFWMVFSEFEGLYGDQASEAYAAFVDELYLAYDAPEAKVYYYHRPADQ